MAPAAKKISGLDFGLAIAAAVVCVVAVVMVSLLLQMQ
jgi:hypothetical protein